MSSGHTARLGQTPGDREPSDREARVGAIVLAAGSSRRAGELNKLLHLVDGEPMIRRVVRTTIEAGVCPCLVVLGHEAERVREVLRELPVGLVVNEAHAEGIGSSIARGIAAIEATDVDAVLVVLGDMPWVTSEDLGRLRAAHRAHARDLVVVPEAGEGAERRLGNPVLWPRCYFEQLSGLRGDRGAKRIFMENPGLVVRVPIDHPGILRDVDAP